MFDKIKPAIDSTAYDGVRNSSNYDFVDAEARTNVEFTIGNIRTYRPVLSGLEKPGGIKIVSAMYDVNNGKVDFMGDYTKTGNGFPPNAATGFEIFPVIYVNFL